MTEHWKFTLKNLLDNVEHSTKGSYLDVEKFIENRESQLLIELIEECESLKKGQFNFDGMYLMALADVIQLLKSKLGE